MSRGPRWHTTALVLVSATAVLWIVGALMASDAFGRAAAAGGLVLVTVAALSTLLLVIRNWLYKLDIATTHGYHAGYHRAIQTRCTPVGAHCDVLDMAEGRVRHLSRMN